MNKKYNKISTYFFENLSVVIPLCITALLFDGLMCFIPQIEGDTIDSLLDNDFHKTLKYVIGFILLVVFVQTNRFFKRFLVRVFGNKITLRMRKISLQNLLSKDMDYFIKNSPGDILNRNFSDIYDTTEGIRKMTTEVFDTIVLLIGYLISMFFMDYKITLIVSIFIVLSILASHFMKHFVYKSNKEYKEYLSINKEMTLSKLKNELNYRGFGVSENYYKEYEKSVNILKKKNTKTLIFQSSLEPLYSSVAFLGIGFIAYIGGMNVIDGVYKIGTLSAYITTFLLVARKAAKVGKVFNAYQGFKVSWVRCRGYMEEDTSIKPNIEIKNSTLELKDYSFSYNEGFKTSPFSMICKSRDVIGICGKVHTGKSSILKGLTGLYDYSGSALLSENEIKELKNNTSQLISYCSSDVYMFSDTLENNIRLGRDGNLEETITSSCLNADLEEIGGLDYLMSRTNSNISGGQQKRVQLSRAIYVSSPLVLLDDPFQSVSNDMAINIITNLKKKNENIIMFVSNNCNVLEKADKIIYLTEDEVIVDTYKNLLLNSGFAKMMGGK